MITRELATVYYGGGRRWFSSMSAARAEARAMMKARCDCDSGGEIGGETTCKYHSMESERWKKLRDKLARRILLRSY